MEKQTEEKKAPPVQKFRAGGISADIWENKGKKEDKDFSFNTITLQRAYQDKEENWQHTNSLRVNDLPKAILVLRKAYEHLVLKQEEEEK